MGKEGTVRGITREYINPRLTWLATQANKQLTSMANRIQQLKVEWDQNIWEQGRQEKDWAKLSLDTADIQNTWNFWTNRTQKSILTKDSMVLLLEGMTKMHKQLGKHIPALDTISMQCELTAAHYSKKKIVVDTS